MSWYPFLGEGSPTKADYRKRVAKQNDNLGAHFLLRPGPGPAVAAEEARSDVSTSGHAHHHKNMGLGEQGSTSAAFFFQIQASHASGAQVPQVESALLMDDSGLLRWPERIRPHQNQCSF